MELKRTIAEWRAVHTLNKADMARAINIPYTTYLGWEENPKSMKIENAEMIAEFFGTTLDGIIFLPPNRAKRSKINNVRGVTREGERNVGSKS